MLTASRLREVMRYEPETGLFQWISKPRGRATADWFAGTQHGSGYLVICIDGSNYRAHRLAWLYVKGDWPKRTIDHKNRVRSDNRFSNLREASTRRNTQNQDGGVEMRETKRGLRWRARITHAGRLVTVGTFQTREEAESARIEAKKLMHAGYIPRISPEKNQGPEGP